MCYWRIQLSSRVSSVSPGTHWPHRDMEFCNGLMQEFPEWTGDCAPCDFSVPVPDISSPIIFGLNRIACLGIHCTADIQLTTTCGGRKVCDFPLFNIRESHRHQPPWWRDARPGYPMVAIAVGLHQRRRTNDRAGFCGDLPMAHLPVQPSHAHTHTHAPNMGCCKPRTSQFVYNVDHGPRP